ERRYGGLLRLMNKGRGASPSRGMRSPTATRPAKRPPFDPLRVAAEIVAALADAVVVTGVDRRVVSANRAAAGLVGRPPDPLARSEARYRNLFESASDAIATFDANGRFTTFNHAAEIISGYRREELQGQWFAPLLPDDELPKALGHFQKALAGETGLFETNFYRKDGEVRTIQVTYSTPRLDEEVLCVIRDVTDQKMLQEQLIQSAKMS